MTPNTPRTSVFDSGDFNFFMSSIREAIGERSSLETTWPRTLTFLRKKKRFCQGQLLSWPSLKENDILDMCQTFHFYFDSVTECRLCK